MYVDVLRTGNHTNPFVCGAVAGLCFRPACHARLFCMHSEDLVVVFYVFSELLHTPTPPAHSHAQLERNKTKYGDFELVVAECDML